MNKCKNIECANTTKDKKVYCSLKCRNYHVNKYLRDYTKNGEGLSGKKFYVGNEKKCQKCGNIISYEQRINRYCSHSCAASETNIGRIVSLNTKNKTKKSIINFLLKNPDFNKKFKFNGTDITIVCKGCSNNIVKTKKIKFCSKECYKNYRRRNMSAFKIYKCDCLFAFSLNSFPNEFNFKLIKQHGWYKPKNRGNNLNGVSRDHMYSICDGFNNSIDPYLISHPANCKLVLQKDNSTKHKKSSITLFELKNRVALWNIKYNNHPI